MTENTTPFRSARTRARAAIIGLACCFAAKASGAGSAADGPRLSDWPYPFAESIFAFESQEQRLEMIYMDVKPTGKAKGNVALLHGKNFSGSYFEATARALAEAGYRVILPDQIGFGKSSKPERYQFSFHALAENTKLLFDELGIERAHILGHSMGGMIAARFALMHPETTDTLILLNPIGLEDWKAKGVPYRTIESWLERELAQTADKIRAYQKESYYAGEWRPAYDPWVEQLAAFIDSPDYPRMAWNQALTYDMIFTQPVVYELSRLSMPTLLIIGQRDTTALGKDSVSPKLRDELGDYPQLGRAAHAAIPRSELVELVGVGHLPHIEAFDRFRGPLLDFLKRN